MAKESQRGDDTGVSFAATDGRGRGKQVILELPAYASQLPEDCWKRRECGRGRGPRGCDAIALPWYNEEWWQKSTVSETHFAYVSAENPSQIAYTPSERFGREDRQLRQKPGKFLRKFFPELGEKEITRWARKWAEDLARKPLHFADTPEECARVYEEGPNSCMSGDMSDRSAHPASIYGGPDTRVAYLTDDDTPEGQPTARAVVHAERKVYASPYGDTWAINGALSRGGFLPQGGENGDFDGARMLLIRADYAIVCPWLDTSPHTVTPKGDFLVISRRGEYDACNTSGFINGITCDRCECTVDEDESSCVDDEQWCQSCYEEHAFWCERCEETGTYDNCRTVVTGPRGEEANYCEYCADNCASQCHSCEKHFSDNDCTMAESADGDAYCQECAEEKLNYCEHCEKHTDGDTVEVDDETWCKSCAASDATECKRCGILNDDTSADECEGDECEAERRRNAA